MGCGCGGSKKKTLAQTVLGDQRATTASPAGVAYRVSYPDGGYQDYTSQGEAAREANRTGGSHATVLTSAVF